MKDMKICRKAFTLIELLIVVAIIAILAAIAVPNFLEAQIRSKVSRVKADMRSLTTALEAYSTDYNAYPPDWLGGYSFIETIWMLTTPVAYMSSTHIADPFISVAKQNGPGNWIPDYLIGSYRYFSMESTWAQQCHPGFLHRGWVLNSFGPDGRANYVEHIPYIVLDDPTWRPVGEAPWYTGVINQPCDMIYDATNGTKSAGDIPRFGGDVGKAMSYNG